MISIALTPLKKALASLKRSLEQPENEFIRNSTIQCFEFSYELCWKYSKRFFELNQGLKDQSAKGIWREAGRLGLIDSVEDWFQYHEARNLTSHTYNETIAITVYNQAKNFYPDAVELLSRLEKLL